jgi:hypothetical protein
MSIPAAAEKQKERKGGKKQQEQELNSLMTSCDKARRGEIIY